MRTQLIMALIIIGSVNFIQPVQASDYKLGKQNEACYKHLYQWKAENFNEYLINRNECNRYGMLILQENMKQEKQEWLAKNVWLVKHGEWQKKRKALGQYIRREAVTAYFAMMLQEEGIDIFRPQEIVGRPLRYVDMQLSSFSFEKE